MYTWIDRQVGCYPMASLCCVLSVSGLSGVEARRHAEANAIDGHAVAGADPGGTRHGHVRIRFALHDCRNP
ncbi:transposase [Burkholderia lata]|nr:transposase [Burkholderia lata]